MGDLVRNRVGPLYPRVRGAAWGRLPGMRSLGPLPPRARGCPRMRMYI